MNIRPAASFSVLLLLAAALAAQQPPAPPPGQGIPEGKTMQTTASGLQWGVLQPGRDGPHPTATDTVRVHYTGWLTDGTKFDSSRDRGKPAEFPLNRVIAGWTEGLQLMTPGARFKFVIPPALGYGAQDKGRIPPESTLVFDVELLEIVRLPEFVKPDSGKQKACASGLKYEQVKQGTGAQVGAEEAAVFRFAIWSPEGQLFQCTEQGGHKLAGTAKTLQPGFLRELLATAKVGDVYRCAVPAALLPDAGRDTVWEVELLSVQQLPKFTASDPQQVTTTDSGLQYEVRKAGTGKRPTAASTVRVHYTGWLTDGTSFDSSHARGEPIELRLDQVVKGWTEGLQLMQEGAVHQLTIPPALGYGDQDQGVIPPNSTLVFLIELLEVK